MAYVTHDYYANTFHGEAISEQEFDRIAQDAGVMLDGIVQRPVEEADMIGDMFKRAVCYQIETLKLAGGPAGVTTTASRGALTSFDNDGYSESRERINGAATFGGLPVSAMAIAVLREMGYMNRWVYAGRDTP